MSKKVDRTVNKILDSYFSESERSNIVIEDIIRQQGIDITYLSYRSDGMRGSYTVATKDNIRIEYSKETYDLYYMRKRFALAHALGHIILGHSFHSNNERCDGISNYSSVVTDIEELEANEFARKILVPRDLFDAAVLRCKNFETICDYFDVSEVLMKMRIAEITGL